jgi:hypothetical protein
MSNPIVSTITLPRTLATGFVIAAIAAIILLKNLLSVGCLIMKEVRIYQEI